MSNNLRNSCQLCTKKHVATRKKEDVVERTTNCRIMTETGTVLNVQDVYGTIDDEYKRRHKSCLCDEESLSSSSASVRKRAKQKSNKTKEKEKASGDKKPQKQAGYQADEAINSCALLKNLVNKEKVGRRKLDSACVEKFKSIILPKWFHQLSTKQVGLVEELHMTLDQALHVGTFEGVQYNLIQLGLNPYPNMFQVLKAADRNPVLFLLNILQMQKKQTSSVVSVSSDFKIINGTDPLADFSFNERVIMSSIAYLEMPLLLQTLTRRLPFIPYEEVPDLPQYKPVKSEKNKNPYLEPICVTEPHDWLADRLLINERRKIIGQNMRRAPFPIQLLGDTSILTHINEILRVPSVSVVSITPSEVEVEIEECRVKMFKRLLDEDTKVKNAVPATPPPSWSIHEKGKDDQSTLGSSMRNVAYLENTGSKTRSSFYKGVVESVKDVQSVGTLLRTVAETLVFTGSETKLSVHHSSKEDEDPEYSDIQAGIFATIDEFKERGMICVQFPGIESHPFILQLLCHLQRLEINQKLTKSLLKKTQATDSCLRELFGLPLLSENNDQAVLSTWAKIEPARKTADIKRRKYLNYWWRERYQTGQNLWLSLNPGFTSRRNFLPTFYAYFISAGYQQVNSFETLI